jgi:hypothetical protein
MLTPSVGPVDRFGGQPEYPQVLDGLQYLQGLQMFALSVVQRTTDALSSTTSAPVESNA